MSTKQRVGRVLLSQSLQFFHLTYIKDYVHLKIPSQHPSLTNTWSSLIISSQIYKQTVNVCPPHF